ncbi:DEAD/DEAH box helicase [Pectobacterium brasiliense]|uniref:DEAD/DEAH box helicase n=1 Tax=Pectobacterium brasiliense TaxID=180957 RepID=UPI000B969FFC|nr:DEAD/DEAH box helicase [Pectobacterium carotovorum]OYN51382.1 hypothetical protein B7L51_09700 [Pectobacterium carotovorum]
MAYSIDNGLVELDGFHVEPNVVFRLGKFVAEMDGCEYTLIVSKRPAELKFEFGLVPSPFFTLYFKDIQLDSVQVNSLVRSGYFIINKKRVHFVSQKLREYIVVAYGELGLSGLLKLLRQLYVEGLIDTIPSSLINQLREKQNNNFHRERLFVRELYPYQKDGVAWLTFCAANGVGTILADDMGLGKTAQVIALCCDVLENDPKGIILVVVPNPLLANWLREFKFFAPKLKPFLHYGPNRSGLSSTLSENNIIITPYTALVSDIAMFEEIFFDLVLYDEASMLKNPRSGRSLAARRLNTGTAVAMSGTPVENSLLDVWALSDLVFPGFLGSEQQFRSLYVHTLLSETLRTDLHELESSLRQITLRRMKKEVLTQLPDKMDIHRAVSLSQRERDVYDSIISEIQQDTANSGKGILPLIIKLQQFTAHPALLDSSISHDVNSLTFHSSKFELLMIELDGIARSGEKVVIFATFQKAIDLIQSAVKEKFNISSGVIDGRTPNDERQPLIDKFSVSSGFDVLILHPRTAGMGLNITAATNVIHYSRQWNPALEAQATARAWRNGQKSAVSVYYMYYADTIEEMIDERIRLKQQLSDQVVTVADYKETDKQLMLEYLESLKNDTKK